MFWTNIYWTTQYWSIYWWYISVIVVDNWNSVSLLQLDQSCISSNNVLQWVTWLILWSLEQSLSCWISITPNILTAIYWQYNCRIVSVVKISVDTIASTLLMLEWKWTAWIWIRPSTISMTLYINQVNWYVFLPEKIRPTIVWFWAETIVVQANWEKTLASIKQEKINILK